MDKVILPRMTRYLQHPGNCSIAATASIGHFFDKRINYDFLCKIAKPDGQGLFTPQIGELLNKIGFTSVKVITADLSLFDFKWQNLSRLQLVEQLKEFKRRNRDESWRGLINSYIRYLMADDDNNVVIDMHFGDYIRRNLIGGTPVMASFNWNLFFNRPKWNDSDEIDPIKGIAEEHEVIICGFNEKGVKIVDSHHKHYKKELKRYASGRYEIKWETLMTVLGQGDLIIPGGFDKERLDALVEETNKNSK